MQEEGVIIMVVMDERERLERENYEHDMILDY